MAQCLQARRKKHTLILSLQLSTLLLQQIQGIKYLKYAQKWSVKKKKDKKREEIFWVCSQEISPVNISPVWQCPYWIGIMPSQKAFSNPWAEEWLAEGFFNIYIIYIICVCVCSYVFICICVYIYAYMYVIFILVMVKYRNILRASFHVFWVFLLGRDDLL